MRGIAAGLTATAILAGGAFAAADASAIQRLTPVSSGSPVQLVASSEDGARVIFTSTAQLVPGDTDLKADVYENGGGVVTLLSTGTAGGNGAFDATGKGASRDGAHVFFETKEQLVAADTDTRTDVYEHAADGTHLRTRGPGGTFGNGNTAADDATFLKATENGLQMWFRTNEQLSGTDTNSSSNAYRAIGDDVTYFPNVTDLAPERILPSPDGSRLVFASSFPLGNDPDASGAVDVFSLDFPPPPTLQPAPVLLSTDDANTDTSFVVNTLKGASRTGTRVVFETDVPLVSADDDAAPDLYQRAETGLLFLTGPESVFLAQPVTPSASFEALSENGNTVMFTSREKLTAGDVDGKDDVFVHRVVPPLGVPFFERVSNGLTGGNGAVDALPAGLSADGSHAYFETTESLTLADTDGGALDVYENDEVTTRLVSTGPADGGAPDPQGSHLLGSSPNGARAYFTSGARLTADDTDASVDLYVREAGVTTLLSIGPAGGNGAFDVEVNGKGAGVSADGSRAIFRTLETLDGPPAAGWNLYASGAPAVTPPAPGPAPSPVSPNGPAPDTVKPKISFALVKGQTLKGVLKSRSIALRVGCDEACRLTATLDIAGASSAAKRRPVRLGTLSVSFAGKGSRVAKVRLTKAGRSALRKARRSARVTTALTATDTAGNRAARTTGITLKR